MIHAPVVLEKNIRNVAGQINHKIFVIGNVYFLSQIPLGGKNSVSYSFLRGSLHHRNKKIDVC